MVVLAAANLAGVRASWLLDKGKLPWLDRALSLAGRGRRLDRVTHMVEWGEPGYSLVRRETAMEFQRVISGGPKKGHGTFVTDAAAMEDVIGGLRTDHVSVSERDVTSLARALGLDLAKLLPDAAGPVRSRVVGFIYEIDDLAARMPKSPLRNDDNRLFKGPGMGLPGGAPEITVQPIATAGGGGIRRVIVLELE